MRSLALLLLLTGGALAQETTTTTTTTTTTEAQKQPPLRIAVYELEVAGIDPRLGRVVTDSLVAELRKLQRISVVSMDEVRAMLDLESQKQMAGCGSEDSCLAEIAEALGVDGVVMGSLSAVGEDRIFSLRRLDQRQGKAVGAVSQRLTPANGEEFLAIIGPAIEQLFPEHPLRAGASRGVSAEMALRVNPPPLPAWVFWSGAATTGVAATSAAVLGVVNLLAVGGHDTYAEGAVLEGKTLTEKRDLVVNSGVAAWSAVGVTAVAAGATGVIALFTDFDGLREAKE